MKAVRKL